MCSVCAVLAACMFLGLTIWYLVANWCALHQGRLCLQPSAVLICLEFFVSV